jgi:hypothetical protein
MSGPIPLKWRAADCCGCTCSTSGAGLGHLPDHSRITHSRNRTAPAGHARTSSEGNLSSARPYRSRRDTRGHAADTVRDREAPGSNPGPPTSSEFGFVCFCLSSARIRGLDIPAAAIWAI